MPGVAIAYQAGSGRHCAYGTNTPRAGQATARVDVQEAGETIFVPSGWHHCVHNVADTLSINHNWLNAHNLHWALALLQSEREDAVAAIQDCRSAMSMHSAA